MHGFIRGGVHGFMGGACVVLFGGCVWFYLGGVHGFIRRGMRGFMTRMHSSRMHTARSGEGSLSLTETPLRPVNRMTDRQV